MSCQATKAGGLWLNQSLLNSFEAEFGPALAKHGVYAARIPEHTCHKVIDQTNICELQKCIQECSKEPAGMGNCRDNICYCTYYCKDPPM
ncbi:S locus-related glycoprotein 1 binding pollen coat [Corchorus olitorius]|uniref:S locus-related glycoprotein 1 binding pollen coat n=1 Tax=Corchorus olitorius TaxID=93759 RepID=A0A1R3HEW8_9ROSI|nr:S locus-related glycoprotein 1 binding pollen coat [Corchorus olitorius]